MRKTCIFEILTLGLFALSACHEEPMPVEETFGDLIRVSASGSDVATRGLLDKADLKTAGTTVKVYDYLTGFTGKIDNQSYTGGDVLYIDDSVVLGTTSGDDWAFQSAPWRWTRTGTHNFYGWLTKDKDGLTPGSLSSGWTPSISASNVLSVPAITMTPSTAQFDFSYSDKVSVPQNQIPDDGVVLLPLNHLFSALALTIENQGEDIVKIVSLDLSGLNNNKSAVVNYSGSAASITYSVAGEATSILSSMEGAELTNGVKLNLYNGSVASSDPDYILMWPQTAAEVKTAVFTLRYTIEGIYSTEEGLESELNVFESELKFSDTGRFKDGSGQELGLDAGKKYALNILFKGKTIELKLVVMPWDYQTFDLDYSKQSISANNANGIPNEGVMWLSTWEKNAETGQYYWASGDPATRTVTMESGKNVRGSFYIGSPHSGRWQLTMYPAEAASYFTIEPSSGEITEDLIKNHQGLVEFLVKPNGPVPSQQTVHFNVSFQFNGETQWRDGNSEFNRKDWKIIREP